MQQLSDNKLFVYGSLRSGFDSPAYEYITRFFSFIGKGKVKGRLYNMGEYPAALPSTEDAFILGELYEIKNKAEFSWAIGQLDDYEGVLVEYGETQLYRRELSEIYINDQVTTAWVYWFNGSVEGRQIIESGDILDYLGRKFSS